MKFWRPNMRFDQPGIVEKSQPLVDFWGEGF